MEGRARRFHSRCLAAEARHSGRLREPLVLCHFPRQDARYGHPRARSMAGLGSIGGLTIPRCLLHHFLEHYCSSPAKCEPSVWQPSIGTVDPTLASPRGNHVGGMVENVVWARGCPNRIGRSNQDFRGKLQCAGSRCRTLHRQSPPEYRQQGEGLSC